MEVVENALIHGLADDRRGRLFYALFEKTRCFIQIQDLGRGIAAENLGGSGPFFTTERGRGRIGLGLTEVFNLVAFQLGGALSIDGSEGSDCIVSIEFPTRLAKLGKLGFTPIIEFYSARISNGETGLAKVVSK